MASFSHSGVWRLLCRFCLLRQFRNQSTSQPWPPGKYSQLLWNRLIAPQKVPFPLLPFKGFFDSVFLFEATFLLLGVRFLMGSLFPKTFRSVFFLPSLDFGLSICPCVLCMSLEDLCLPSVWSPSGPLTAPKLASVTNVRKNVQMNHHTAGLLLPRALAAPVDGFFYVACVGRAATACSWKAALICTCDLKITM